MHNYHTPLGFLNTYKYLISVCVCICVYQCWYHVALYLLSCDISVWKIIPTDKSVPGIHRSGKYKNLLQLSEFWNSHITRWTSTTYCKPLCKRGLSTFSKMPICRHFENYDSQAFVICHPIGETWLLSNSFVQTRRPGWVTLKPQLSALKSYLCFECNPTPVGQTGLTITDSRAWWNPRYSQQN